MRWEGETKIEVGWCCRVCNGGMDLDIVENSKCDIGRVVNDDANELESIWDSVLGLGGGESSVGLWTGFVMGIKTRTACLEAWALSHPLDIGV